MQEALKWKILGNDFYVKKWSFEMTFSLVVNLLFNYISFGNKNILMHIIKDALRLFKVNNRKYMYTFSLRSKYFRVKYLKKQN